MTSEYRKQTDPGPEPDYADPPHPPIDVQCEKIPTDPPNPPEFEPEPCDPSKCKCPAGPGSSSNCIVDLIAEQDKQISAAEKAKVFKADLDALLGKAKAASQDYTQEKYEKLCKLWAEEDSQIVELIRKLACTVDCWECVIECYICPRINELHTAQQWLDGDGKLPTDAHNLYDVQYWRMRDKEKKERQFKRIKDVLTAWEKPAQAIEKILTDNAKLISDSGKLLATEPGKVIYDIFFRLVPLHLAIAPPSGLDWKNKGDPWRTNILKEHTEFCPCDTGTLDPCCGLNFGEPSMRERVIGLQPYLVDPNKYFDLICCVVQERYAPAKDLLAVAEAELNAGENKIKSLKAQIENGLKSFDKDARAAIPSVIDCDDCKPTELEESS